MPAITSYLSAPGRFGGFLFVDWSPTSKIHQLKLHNQKRGRDPYDGPIDHAAYSTLGTFPPDLQGASRHDGQHPSLAGSTSLSRFESWSRSVAPAPLLPLLAGLYGSTSAHEPSSAFALFSHCST